MFYKVLQNKPRNVILCLMEVSRLASRFGLEPPGLVQLENEIDAEEARDQNDSKICTPNIRHRLVLLISLKGKHKGNVLIYLIKCYL